MLSMKIPVFTDEVPQQGGWHGMVLAEAFAQKGHEAVMVDLRDCAIDLTGDRAKISIPYFNEIPQLAFVRGIAPGSLQQVITRLNILHILSMLGTTIYNNAKAIERTVDKGMTSFLLKQNGLATPATTVCESRALAHATIKTKLQQENELVIKPLFGSQGKGVRLLDANNAMPLPGDEHVDGVFYLQSKINTGENSHDYRVFVIRNKAVAAMRRTGDHWLHNVAKGAKCQPNKEAEILYLAEQAALAINIQYCGVDIIRDASGNLSVLEVNSIPAWRGLQSVTDVNIAQLLVDDLLSATHV